jgi:site-specific DNA recombinase
VTDALTAASYERVSTRLQGQTGFSLGAQEKDSAQFAADNQWVLPSDLRFRDGEDRAASGSDWDLPGLNAMLDAARDRRFSVLVVPTVDRFARDMGKAILLESELRKLGVRVVYINAPIDDTAEGRLLLRQLQSFAEFEREKIAFRTSRGRREKIERGQILGSGPSPYGYRYVRVDQGARKRVVGLEPDPLTAPVVERIFKAALRRSAEQIVDSLRADGVVPPIGYNRRTPALRWSRDIIQRILTHPVYAGTMIYGGADGRRRAALLPDIGANGVPVPPIIDRQLWDDVQAALQRRQKTRRGRSAEDIWLLRGLLTCGHCGGSLCVSFNSVRATAAERARGKKVSGSYRQYECLRAQPQRAARELRETCPMRAVRAEQIEAVVWRAVHDVLMNPDALRSSMEQARARYDDARARHDERLAVADHEIARLVSQIERLIDELLETPKGTESYRALIERQRRIEDTLQRLRAERARIDVDVDAGISPLAADEIAQFSQQVAAGLSVGSVADRRWVLDQLRVQAKVRMDPTGVQFGRVKRNRYAVDLDGIVQLDAGGAVSELKGRLALSLAFEPWLTLRLRIIDRSRPVGLGLIS